MKSHSAVARGARAGKARGKAIARSSRFRNRGQQSIQQERMIQIQEALIREHYLTGVPSGELDQATREALVRLQADNHWQTKRVPDSRALIKLGLGPSPQNLLNPESAAIATAYPSAARASETGTN